MSTPISFVLPKPMDIKNCPSPTPPSYMKHQVYDDPNVFEKVDYHAIRVAKNKYSTFRDLLWDLVFRYKLNDLEKARVIFRWMTSCDVNNLSFKTAAKNSPEEVLLSLKNLKGSYASAFELMCSYAGLYCRSISGYAKGVDYRPGDMFKGQAFNHSWNVIYIQDSWQLVDAHWATRYLTAHKNTQDSIVYQYDDFYFIMEPQQAVYSHFPQDPSWQLLKEPLTLNQFENLPLTKSQFFKCGMDFNNQHHGVVHSKDGNLKISLGFWKPDSFTYKLVTDTNADVYQGISLKYFVIQETVNNKINFYFRFPAAGNYYLTVFVQELNEHNLPVNKENIFRAACEYKVIADKAASNSKPYPMSCHDLNWGPQWSLISHYNLVPVQEDGVISIKSPEGKPFVQTDIKFERSREEVELLCKLRKNGVNDEDVLDQYIQIDVTPNQTSFFINLPEPGEYGLEIYANEPSEGDIFTHICQYLLDFEPPPGYKPQTSIFGPIKTGSSILMPQPSNIKEMYNYEKDAVPLGNLPNPYLVSQYAPEDATMIPGQTKNKEKPFAYNQKKKSDDSDLEMPDFLPPPPPVLTVPPYEENKPVPILPPDSLKNTETNFPHPPPSIKFNGTSGSLTDNYGQKLIGPKISGQESYLGDSYSSLQSAIPFRKSPSDENRDLINYESIHHQSMMPFEKKNVSDDELMEQTVKLQPYLVNVEKGLSPQLSRKIYDNSVKNKNPDHADDNNDKDGVKQYDSIKSDTKSSGLKNYSSMERNDWIGLSELGLVSSAFGKDDSITAKQPYLQNLESGRSPVLSRKPFSNQTPLLDSGPSGKGLSSFNSNEDLRNDYKGSSVFRGYARPNFAAGEGDSIKVNLVTGQALNPSSNEEEIDDHSGPYSNIHRMSPFKEGTYKPVGPTPYSESQGGWLRSTSYKENSAAASDGSQHLGYYGVRNPGEFSKSSSNVTLGRNSPFREESSKTSDPGYLSGSYTVRSQLELGDPKKISNMAVTLSPSGFRKPNALDSSSDQYNNQYEDSSKILPSPIQKYRPDDSTANWTSGPVQKEPPQNFQPKPIDVKEEVYKPEVQALPKEFHINTNLSPEETSKIFARVDDHAMQVSAQHQDSFNQLIWQLIYARNITDELEKVRVIFLWLCTKDLHKMNFDDIKKDSPEEILMGLKTGKSTYAQIFLTLCRYAGLHCKLIVGYAKGADYVPGMKFQGRHGEHSWNAVLIAGVWRLVDCHWAARRLIGKERKPENVRYELDMFYFLANPSQLIYTHFPHEQDWQLLHHPINIDEFESLAPVKSMFFKYNLDLVTHKNAVIFSETPEFELRIAFPKGVEERLLFTFTLTFNDGSDEYNGMSLLRYGRQEIDYTNSHSSFYIRAPIPGSYKLLLYTKLISAEQNVPESGPENMFGAICEYKIEFDFPTRRARLPFPPCQTSTYGPSEVYKKYFIEACVNESSIYTDNGTVEIKFLILKPETRVIAKLINNSNTLSDRLTEQCVLQRLVANEEALINVFLPEPGEYGLEVYANNSKKDGNSFYTVWQYFIVTKSASTVDGLPSLPPGYMGPYEPKFTNYGLSTYSHKDPFIVANTGDLCIQMKTTREKPVRIMTQLIHCSHNVAEMCANQVLQQARDSIVYFLVRFPHKGFFKLQIFALPYSEMSESLPGVFNYLIEANQSSSQKIEFPQQFAQWKEGCYLHEPINGVLGVGERPDSITFRMEVPRAHNIAVVVNGEWTRLQKDGKGVWAGNVDMRKIWVKSAVDQLTVCANYGASLDDSYTTILKYVIN